MIRFLTLLIALSSLGVSINNVFAAPPVTRACAAPPLPAPTGNVVNVSTEPQLRNAIANVVSNQTIVLAPGIYNLATGGGTLYFNKMLNNVIIRGATDSCDDVILVGNGMTVQGNTPYGIWVGGGSNSMTIANLTIKGIYYHPIILNSTSGGVQSPHIYNVHLIDAGEQFVKSNPSGTIGVNDGVVEYSIMEYTTTARSNYTNGVDVHTGANWIVRNNLFRNIRAPAGQLAGPAVLMWNGSRDSMVENNLFLNVQYGIALGLNGNKSDDHIGGIVRNNFFHRSSSQNGDVGITINNSVNTKVLHNTVILNGTYPNAIEYRFAATTGVEIRYNLADGIVKQRDGATGSVANNVTNAQPSWFTNAATGDLHLVATSAAAIDKAATHANVPKDYDAETRPQGAAPDIGADEFSSSGLQPPLAPINLKVTP